MAPRKWALQLYFSTWSELGLTADIIWNVYKVSKDCPKDQVAGPLPKLDSLSWEVLYECHCRGQEAGEGELHPPVVLMLLWN